jgi:hypothetical protein
MEQVKRATMTLMKIFLKTLRLFKPKPRIYLRNEIHMRGKLVAEAGERSEEATVAVELHRSRLGEVMSLHTKVGIEAVADTAAPSTVIERASRGWIIDRGALPLPT